MANLSSEERRKRYSTIARKEDIEQSEARKDINLNTKADERRNRYASKDYLEKYNAYHAPTRYDGSAVNRYLNAYGLNQQRQADRMQEYRNRYAQQQFMNAQRDAIRNGVDNGNNPLGLKNLENPLDNMRRLEAYKEAYGKNHKLSYDESQKLEKAYGKYNRQQLEQLKEHFKNAPERDYSGEIAWVNEKLLKTATGKENKQRQNILESQIKDADNRLERLQEAYADRLVGGGTDNGDYLDKVNQIKQEKSQLQNELNDYKELTNYSDQDDFAKYRLLGESNPNNPVRFFRTHSDEQANAIFDPTIRNEVDTAHHESTYTGGGSNQSDRALYRAITDEEADNYSYILGKYGQEEADKYLQAVAKHTDVNGSLTALQEAQEQGYKNPLLRTAESIGLGLITPVEAAKNLISGDEVRTYDDYKLAGRQEALRSGAAEKLTGGNEIGTFLYNTATGAADNLLRYAVGGGIGAVTGEAGAAEGAMRLMMGGQVMDSAMKNALDRGLSDSQAVTTALISAVNEELFETISLSNLKAMQSVTPKNYRELAKNIGKQFLGEGSEEMFTDIGNAIADDLVNGEKSEIRQNILNYMKQGMSEEEAKKQASVDFALQLVESGLSGGITGAAMGGAVAVDQAKSIKANQKYNELFNTYKELGLSEEDAVNTALSEVMNGLQTVRNKKGNVKGYKGLNKSIDKAIASAKNINENVKNIEAEMNGVAPVSEEDIRDNEENIRDNEVNNEYLTDMQRVLSHGDITTDAQAQQFLSDQDEMVAKYPDKKDEIIKATVDVYMNGKNNAEVFDSIVSKVANTMAKNETSLESKNTTSEGISQKEDKPAKVDFKANINGEEAVITSVNKNNMTVRDSVGNETTIPINAAEMTDGASAAVEQAKQYGKRGSRLYLENMAGNIRDYTYTFNDFYNAGKQGKEFYGRNTRGLNTDFLREVYDAGVQDGSKASKTGGLVRNDARYTIQESEARVLDAVGKAFNVTIQMDHMLSHDANGYLSDGIIHISTSAEKPSLVVFSHEFTHRLEDTSPEAYKAYKDYVINYLKKTSDEEGNNVYETREIDLKNAYASQGVELSDKELQDELVANATESFLSDTDFIEDLVKENKSLAQQILDVLKQMLEDLKNVFAEKYDAKSKEGKALQDDLEAREEAIKLWTNAIKNQNKEAVKKTETKFSLKNPVEETKNLIAVHNLWENDLIDTLKLGGFPMPSIAVTKSEMGHDMFGNISVVFNKDAIDPKKSKDNAVFSGDAYTPTFPHVEFEADSDKIYEIRNKIEKILGDEYKLFSNIGLSFGLDNSNIEDYLNRNNGNVVEAVKNKPAYKYAYLKDKNIDFKLPMKEAPLSRNSKFDNETIKYLNSMHMFNDYNINQYLNDSTYIYNQWNKDGSLDDVIKKINAVKKAKLAEEYPDEWEKLYKLLQTKELSFSDVDNLVYAIRKYNEEGLLEEIDTAAIDKQINNVIEKHNNDYEKWLKNLFDGVIATKGIRNNKDIFTPSGNRRSFKQLHDDVTLSNIVKAMKADGEQGIAFGGNSIFGGATRKYESIADIHSDENRLKVIDKDEYSKLQDEISNDLFAIAERIKPNDRWDTWEAKNDIVEAIIKRKTKNGIKNFLSEWYNIDDEDVNEILNIVERVRNLPTGYFEAKPRRAVGFDEVAYVIIPNNASQELIDLLNKNNIEYMTYEEGNKEDWTEKLNSRPDIRFSLKEMSDKELEKLYDEAVNKLYDMNLASEIVKQYANNKGFTKELYHGTSKFGFTKLDTKYSDDNLSFFTSDNPELAGTYSGYGNKKKIYEYTNIDKMNINEVVKAFNNLTTKELKNHPDYVNEKINAKITSDNKIDIEGYGEHDLESAKTFLKRIKLNNDGVYSFYGNLDNMLEIDAKNNNWNQIPIDNKENEIINKLKSYNKLLGDSGLSSASLRYLSTIVGNLVDFLNYNFIVAEENNENIKNKESLLKAAKELDDIKNNWVEKEHLDNDGKPLNFYNYVKNNLPKRYTTRQIAKMAKEDGYDGVIIKNVYDNGGQNVYHSVDWDDYEEYSKGNLYNFFNPQEQLKSADPVTYDDKGNVIPLSERFNKDNADIRFSMKEEYGKGGYNGKSMSNRATKAYEYGEKPLSKWTKSVLLDEIDDILFNNDSGVTVDDFKKLTVKELKDNFLDYSSWHHTGALYNTTDFYKLNEDRILDTTKDDINKIIDNRKNRKAEEEDLKRRKEEQDKIINDYYKSRIPTVEHNSIELPKHEYLRQKGFELTPFTTKSGKKAYKYIENGVEKTVMDSAMYHVNLNDEPDIKYSLKEESNINRNDVAALTGNNEYMAEAVNDLEETLNNRYGDLLFDVKNYELYDVFDEICKQYNIKGYSKQKFARNVKELFDYIKNVDHPDGVDTTMLAMQVAADMLDKGSVLDTTMLEMYPTLPEELRNKKIKISQQDRADLDGGYARFRRKYFGNLTLTDEGTEVDTVYEGLSAQYPELFPSDITHPADRLTQIGNVVDLFKRTLDHIQGASKEESAFIIAQDIINKAVLERTKHEDSIAKNKRLDIQAKVREQVTNLKKAEKEIYYENIRLRRRIKSLESLNNNANNKIAKQEKEWEDYKSGKKQVKGQEKFYRKQYYEKLKEEFVLGEVTRSKAKNRAERQATIDMIKNLTNKLSRTVLRPSENNYVPTYLLNSMIDVLQMIDLDSGYRNPDGSPTKVYLHLQNLKKQYEALRTDAKYNDSGEDEQIKQVAEVIDRIAETVKNKRVNQLTNYELENLLALMKIINYQINRSQELFKNQNYKRVADLSEKARENIKKAGREFDPNAKVKNIANKYLNNTLSPVRLFKRLEGYAKDGALTTIAEELQNGERESKLIKQTANDILKDLYETKEARKLLEEFRTKKLVYKFGEKEVVITPEMRVALYLHSLNEDNYRHIVGREKEDTQGNISYEGGGVVIPNYHKQKKSTSDTLKIHQAEKYTGQDVIKLTPQNVETIIKDMDEYDRMIVSKYKELNSYITDKLNDTTEELYGYKKATVKNYFPIIVDKSMLELDSDVLKLDKTIENMGSLKSRVNSVQPIYLEGVMDAIERQIDQAALFSGMAIPVRDFKKVWGLKTNETTLNREAQKAMGSYIDRYQKNLQGDLGRGREKGDSFALLGASARGKMAMGALTGNLSVVMKQAASYPTAAGGLLGYQDLFAGLLYKGQRGKDLEEIIKKYTPLYADRDTAGIVGVNINDMNALKKKNPKLYYGLTGWIEAVDKATVRRLWYASENYVKRNFKYEVGSDKFYKEVAKVWEDTVRRTQPIYDTMNRPEYLRQNSDLAKFLLMFKTQSFQNIGILVDAVGEYKARSKDYKNNQTETNKKDKEAAFKQLVKATSSQIIQMAVFTAITAIADAMLHRPKKWADEETGLITPESFFETYFENYLGNMLGQLAFGDVIKDAVYIAAGKKYTRYDLTVAPLDAINDVISGLYNARQAVNTREYDKAWKNIIKASETASQYGLGVPVKNIENLYNGVTGNVADIAAGKNPLETTTTQQMYNRIYLAYQSGNPEIAAELSKNVDSDKIKTKMVSKLKEEDTIKEAAEYRYKSELDKYQAIVDAYVSLGFDKDWVVSAINSVMNKTYDTTGSGEYNSNDLQRAIDISAVQGSKVAQQMYDEKYSTYKADGLKNDEAKKKALSSVRSAITGKYKSQYESGTTSQKVKIRDRLCSLRVAGERLYTYDSMKSWNK